MAVGGHGNLFIDGSPANIDLSSDAPVGDFLSGYGTVERTATMDVVAGSSYAVEVRVDNAAYVDKGAPFVRGGIRVGAFKPVDTVQGIQDAVALAKDPSGMYYCVLATSMVC